MKKILLIIGLIIPMFAIAQNNQGEITFNEKILLKIVLPEGQEHLAKMMPSEQNFKKTLLFTADHSIFQDAADSEDSDDGIIEGGNDQMQIKIVTVGAAENKTYKNLKENTLIRKEDFFGKTFLITGEIEQKKWELTGKQKKILDYNCQQATFIKDDKTTEVWFTPEIPVSNGPDHYGQLPGMILETSSNDGDRVITAVKITLRKIEKDEIAAPKKGKKVTAKKFDKIVERKMKEMDVEMGHGTGIKIKID